MSTVGTRTARVALPLGRARNYVGGRWHTPEASQVLGVLNPATGEAIGEVPLSTPAEVDAAVAAAQTAFPAWRATPPVERARFMFRLKERMEASLDDVARVVVQEHGKTLEDARGSLHRAIENVEVAAGIPSLMMGYNLEDGASRGIDEEVVRQPLGVFAAICPFNFPAMVPFWFWPYAVACGNTFIVKPPERVPFTQQRIFELIADVGFPPGVVNLVDGGAETVDALLDHPGITGISFVGSTAVAKHVYARGATAGKRVQAQAGAKNWLVVMPDAALEQAVPNVLGSCFGAAGQRCLAGSVIAVVGDVHQRLREQLVAGARAIRVGNGLDEGVEMGPLISRQALDRVRSYIELGIHEGAELVLDGRDVRVPGHENGFFIGPTIFDRVAAEMAVAHDEIFGPLVCLVHVDSLDQAIELLNRSPFGNAASIFTRDGKAAREFRYRALAGNVGVNVGVAAAMAYFPFGGMKQSFFGALHGQGRDAIEFFTERKVVISRWW